MLRRVTILACCCLWQVHTSEIATTRIIIVGSGPAGIAAGVRLLENGFNDVTILEAENRIGGRLYTTEFCRLPVDLGAQWVHGEENNAIFELVWPLGLLERSSDNKFIKMYSSSGEKMPDDLATDLMLYYLNLTETDIPEEYGNKTMGDWYTHKLDEHFKNHPEIKTEQHEALKESLNLMAMAMDAADTWYNVSVNDGYQMCKGDQLINWKDKTYGFVIDILLKKYPNIAEESPFRNKTVLNAEVTRIDYNNPDGSVRVTTAKGDEYTADHVIVTTSLGVLKADHKTMFNPLLPEVKVNAIETLGFGNVAKIYLYYEEPWWPNVDGLLAHNFYWNAADKDQFVNDPNKSWLLGVYSVFNIEHKPGLLCCWLTSHYARDMEAVPEEQIFTGIKDLLHRFLDKTHNLTEPTAMLRSQWYTNKHFRGTYSYTSPETIRSGAMRSHIAEPIMHQDKPRVLFGGEATSSHQASTVHGAVTTGWREANRLLQHYGRQTTENEKSTTS